jgi:histidinol-phosphate aminotransferase
LPEALADEAYVRRYVSEVREGRERLQLELNALGFPYWRSRANFVLMRLGALNSGFIRRMREQGILVRDRSRDPGCEGCVRITLGSTEQTDRLLPVLRESLREIGALAHEVRP